MDKKPTSDNQFRENTHWPQPNKPQPDDNASFATETDEQRIMRKKHDEAHNSKKSFTDAANIEPAIENEASGADSHRAQDENSGGEDGADDGRH